MTQLNQEIITEKDNGILQSLNEEELENIRFAALFHDIGKILKKKKKNIGNKRGK